MLTEAFSTTNTYIMGTGVFLVVVAQWQNTGVSSQVPGLHSWELLAFSVSSIFCLITSKLFCYYTMQLWVLP